MTGPLKILIVEDVETDAELEMRELKSAGLNCVAERVDTRDGFIRMLGEFAPDVVLSDFSLPGAFDGLEALEIARELKPDLPFIFVSGTIGEERAIEAIKRGATDYVLKTNLKRLPTAVRRAIEEAANRAARREAESKLQESESRFSSFMQHLPGVAFMKDLDGRYVFVNPAFEEAAGRGTKEILGRTDHEIWPEDQAGMFRDQDRQTLAQNGALRLVQQVTQGGETRSWLIHKFPVPGSDGRPALIGGIVVDLTDRVRAEERVARLSRIQAVLSGINSAIVRIRDRQELFREACRIAVEHGGFRMAWVGVAEPGAARLTPAAWQGAENGYLDEVARALAVLAEDAGAGGRVLRGEKRIVANDIENDPRIVYKLEALARGYNSLVALPLEVSGNVVGALLLYSEERDFFNTEEVNLLTELAGDISFALEYIEKEERLSYLAYYDGLTGLANRSLFQERLNGAMHAARRDGTSVVLVLLDLDRFRVVNDTFGRHTGDALLRQVAGSLRDRVLERGGVARIGGDNFAVMLEGVRAETDLAHLLDGLCGMAGLAFSVDGQEIRLSVKAGAAVFPNDGEAFEVLFGNAEAALRKSKASGERYLLYEPQMNARMAERLSLETRLRRALEREQFVLHYQPKVSVKDRSVQGLEALLRWDDPDTGLVSPGRFIPILEETGLILEAGRWVLQQAVRDCLRWSAMGLPAVRVAVNISAIQLRRKDFVDDIRRVVESFGTRSGGLDLEITESMLMDDVEGNIAKLHSVRELAVGIAIDDFGTGYSSLSYIARLPLDTLKIDRSFVVNMVRSADDHAIVSSIISLARALDIEVIAEGVETEEQANMLSLLKCDKMQGYLFSKPVPAAEVEALLRPPS